MMPVPLLRRLEDALLKLPQSRDFSGRTALLGNIRVFNRSEENRRTDISNIVQQLQDNVTLVGEWLLLTFVDNAQNSVADIELGDELADIRKQLVKAKAEIRARQPNPADATELHLFDLQKPALQCMMALWNEKPRMSGFVLQAPTRILLRHFCNSLKYRAVDQRLWKEDRVFVIPVPVEIKLPETPIDTAFEQATRHEAKLASKAVICSIFAPTADDAKAVWLRLCGKYPQALENPFVVVFGIPEGACPAPELIALDPPVFTQKDVRDWVEPIVKCMKWPETVADRWADKILLRHRGSADSLPIEWTYDQLTIHRDLLMQNKDEEAYEEFLAEL
jgi:hypothetical protein